MWNSETNLDYLGVISGKKKSLLHKTRSKFTVSSNGVVFLLDKFDYVNYPKKSDWRNLGIHLDMKLDYDSYDKTPCVIKKLAISEAYSHLIWLSKRAWDGAEIDFVWNLSHELRHLEQSMKSRYLSVAGCFLCRELISKVDIDEPKILNTVPTELDSELAAWLTTRQVISKSGADDYVHKNTESGKKQDEFSILLKYDPEKPYFVCRETIRIMRKYQKQLDEIINLAPPFYYQEIRNVGYITSKLSNIPKTEP